MGMLDKYLNSGNVHYHLLTVVGIYIYWPKKKVHKPRHKGTGTLYFDV